MATPASSACNCDDSALSTTAIILSILTFAYVLIAGSLYQFAVHQRAKNNQDWNEMRAQAAEIRNVMRDISQHKFLHAKVFAPYDDLTGMFKYLEENMTQMFKRLDKTEDGGARWYVIWRGVVNAPRSNKKKALLQQGLARIRTSLSLLQAVVDIRRQVEEGKVPPDATLDLGVPEYECFTDIRTAVQVNRIISPTDQHERTEVDTDIEEA